MNLAKMTVVLAIIALAGWMIYDWAIGPGVKMGDVPEKSAEEPPPSGIYKWTDAHGIVHYTNEKDRIPEEYKEKAEDVKLPALNVVDDSASFDLGAEKGDIMEGVGRENIRRSHRILLYGTSWCPNTKKVRKLLKDLAVSYGDLDIERDARYRSKLMEITGGNSLVPVLVVEKQVIMGYRPEEIRLAVERVKAAE